MQDLSEGLGSMTEPCGCCCKTTSHEHEDVKQSKKLRQAKGLNGFGHQVMDPGLTNIHEPKLIEVVNEQPQFLWRGLTLLLQSVFRRNIT